MPRELVAIAPHSTAIRSYALPPLGARMIRIHTTFASPKHGTEMVGFRNDTGIFTQYDPEWGAVAPLADEQTARVFPHGVGNMATGIVTEIGSGVTRFQPGDHVFGHLPIREVQTVDEQWVDPLPEGMSPEQAVCLDPIVMALAIRDAEIRLGDRVAVFGLGAIGLMVIQCARIAGADLVIGVDPIQARRDLALALGANIVLDPRGDDAGMALRRSTAPVVKPDPPLRTRVYGGYWEVPQEWGHHGVDVAIEASGNIQALHHAIRGTRYGGTIAMLACYARDAAGLHLGDEFHVNRQRVISIRSESLPMRDAPVWTLARYVDVAMRWLRSGRVCTDGIVAPIVPFEESVKAYRSIDERPETSVKLGIRFPEPSGV